MTDVLLVVLSVLLQYFSPAFAASIPSPLLLSLDQRSNSTVAFDAFPAVPSNSSLILPLKFAFPILQFRLPEQLTDPSTVDYQPIPGKRSKIVTKDYG